MYSDSRKAQRNSFAHYRAELLFARPAAQPPGGEPISSSGKAADPSAQLRLRISQVRAGLLGVRSAGTAPAH